MKALNPSTGNLEKVYVRALDGMPVGTIVDYDGQASDIPTGWTTYGTGQIKKTSETRPLGATVVNQYDNSQINAYSTEYCNQAFGGIVLYENATGTTGNITLNDDANNYNMFILTGVDSDNTATPMYGIGILTGNTLIVTNTDVTSTNYSFFTKKYTISNTDLTYSSMYWFTKTQNNIFSYNNFKVRKIVGYK